MDTQLDEWMSEGEQIAYAKVSEVAVFNPNVISKYLDTIEDEDIRDTIEEAIDYTVSNIALDDTQTDLIDDIYVYLIDELGEELYA
jgi:hypothetical protein